MSTSSASPIYFNGISTYSSDLQTVITRAVSIASMPINQLNTSVSTLTSQQSALSALSMSFTSLQSDLAAINTAVGSGNYSVSSSNSGVATASASAGALLGSYTLQIVDPGSQASAVSTATVTDPTTQSISSAASFTLTANGQTYSDIMPPVGTTTLDSLVSAINTATQGAVQATVVNVGTPSQPSYELSIQNTAYGALPITLTDDSGNNLLGDPTTATSVQYTVDGQPVSPQDPLSSDTRTLTLSQNLTVTALAAGSTTITVGQSTSNIANAISSFVSDYNAASQALSAQRGSSGGALSGESVIHTLTASLQSLTHYTAAGSIQSMADLGLTFNDTTGALSFDPTVLTAAAAKDFAGVTSFLGSATGGGFLQAATNTLSSVLDPVSGIIPTELSSTSSEIMADNAKISQDQNNINQLQTNLTTQMASADALIASLQSQSSYLSSLLTSMTANQNQIANG
jgi:flagellar hook-associated protein 2